MATNKRAVEAWWGFLVGAIIAIAVLVVLLFMYGDIRTASLSSVGSIGEKISKIFQ